MTIHSRKYLYVLAVVLGVATAACSGGGASMTAPDAAPPAAAAGATIVGTVQSGTAAAGATFASSTSGLRVSVTGTSLATATDNSGRFTLRGVPAGRAELRFEGPDIDARLEIDGLASGQTLTITVQVSGSSATRVGDDNGNENEVTLRGRVQSISTSENTLMVSDRKILVVTGTTRILGRNDEPIGLGGLKKDDLVEVEGQALANGEIQASKIKLEGEDDDDENQNEEVEFRGQIDSISKPDLKVSGQDVTTDTNTQYRDGRGNAVTFEFFKMNDRVEVDGQKLASGKVLAKKIKLED